MPKTFGGRWEVVDPIDEGGQGWVYKVRDLTEEHDGFQALKRLKNPKRLDRFEKEIQAGLELDIPGVAPVLDYSLADPAFFVTPYYDAPTLEGQAPLSPQAALRAFVRVCEIVSGAHEAGVVHRDLKPENVLLADNGELTVLDFGLCYFTDDEGRLTETMEQVGSRFYMAPELEAGRSDQVGTAADSYSLGKILYYLLTGVHVAREQLRGDNDLVSVSGDAQLEYVTARILEKSVVESPDGRASAMGLAQQAIAIRRLIREHFHPGVDGSRCRFCGEGTYRRAETATITMKRGPRTGPIPLDSVICSRCGNIQWFNNLG